MAISLQITWLIILAIPIACVAWTITKEEIFKELREFCIRKNLTSRRLLIRKIFYTVTCEYCLSHYVTLFFLILTDYKLLLNDWRGYLIAGFSLVWVANLYMSLFGFIRQDIKKEKTEIQNLEQKMKK